LKAEGSRHAKTLVFVAFGDSLTVGYQSPTAAEPSPEPAPYTRFLEAQVRRLLHGTAAETRAEFLNRGVNGELTGEMALRFDRDALERAPDVVIILGGSNDIGWGVEPPSIARNLSGMYKQALKHGIRPVSCTIPSILGFDEGIPPRLELNQLIRITSEALGVTCVDLFRATSDSEGRLLSEYSNDGLHLNSAGYEAMAGAIFSGAVSDIVRDYIRAA